MSMSYLCTINRYGYIKSTTWRLDWGQEIYIKNVSGFYNKI